MISQCKQKCYFKFCNLLITDEKRSWLGTKIMVENLQTSHNMTHNGNERKGTKSTFQAHEFYCNALRITGFLDISYSEQKTVFQNQQVCLYSS